MKKRLLLAFLLVIMLISFVSAQYGYYGTFSLSNFLNKISPATLILFVLFIIFFAVLHNIVFMTFFRGNRGVSAIVSFCVSLLAIYGINRTRWDIGGLFYGIGLSEGSLFTIIIVVLLLIFIYAAFKKKLRYLLLIIGGLLLGLVLFTDLIYEKGIAIVIGLVLLIIGGILLRRGRRRAPYDHGEYPPSGSVRRGYPRERRPRRAERKLGRAYKSGEKWDTLSEARDTRKYARRKRREYWGEKGKSIGGKFATVRRRRDIPAPPQEEPSRREVKRRERTAIELQQKYDVYRSLSESVVRSTGGHIPKRGSPAYKKYHQYGGGIRAIEKLARRQGVKLK